jgi:hypothetical protein
MLLLQWKRKVFDARIAHEYQREQDGVAKPAWLAGLDCTHTAAVASLTPAARQLRTWGYLWEARRMLRAIPVRLARGAGALVLWGYSHRSRMMHIGQAGLRAVHT